MSASEIATEYVGELIEALQRLDRRAVEAIVRVLDATLERRSRIYVIGNGGSAATASHVCSDLGIGLKRRGLAAFDIMSLADNVPVCTAISNDLSYEDVFSAQLDGLIRPDDVLIAISASGNSPNIIRAVRHAQSVGATVVGWSGFDGGLLRELADVSFHVETPLYAYGIVEDAHMVLNHILYNHYAGSK